MQILEIGLRNFQSFGNIRQTIKLNTEKGELILLVGSNGAGKCVEESTEIEIEIYDLDVNTELINFLVETELGRTIFLYIKENNNLLYEKITKFKR